MTATIPVPAPRTILRILMNWLAAIRRDVLPHPASPIRNTGILATMNWIAAKTRT